MVPCFSKKNSNISSADNIVESYKYWLGIIQSCCITPWNTINTEMTSSEYKVEKRPCKSWLKILGWNVFPSENLSWSKLKHFTETMASSTACPLSTALTVGSRMTNWFIIDQYQLDAVSFQMPIAMCCISTQQDKLSCKWSTICGEFCMDFYESGFWHSGALLAFLAFSVLQHSPAHQPVPAAKHKHDSSPCESASGRAVGEILAVKLLWPVV